MPPRFYQKLKLNSYKLWGYDAMRLRGFNALLARKIQFFVLIFYELLLTRVKRQKTIQIQFPESRKLAARNSILLSSKCHYTGCSESSSWWSSNSQYKWERKMEFHQGGFVGFRFSFCILRKYLLNFLLLSICKQNVKLLTSLLMDFYEFHKYFICLPRGLYLVRVCTAFLFPEASFSVTCFWNSNKGHQQEISL